MGAFLLRPVFSYSQEKKRISDSVPKKISISPISPASGKSIEEVTDQLFIKNIRLGDSLVFKTSQGEIRYFILKTDATIDEKILNETFFEKTTDEKVIDENEKKFMRTDVGFYDDTTEKLNKSVNLPNRGKNKFDGLGLVDREIYMMRADFLSLIVYSFNGKLRRYKNLKKAMKFDNKVFDLKKSYYAGYFKATYGIEENQLNSFLDYCAHDEVFKTFLKKDFDQLKLMEFFEKASKGYLEINAQKE